MDRLSHLHLRFFFKNSRVLHAKSAFEEVFEDDKSQDDTESSEVPMELADDE